MASVCKTSNGHRAIQFVASDGRRRTIRLGKVKQKAAEEIKLKVETILSAKTMNLPLDNETAVWVSRIGDDLAGKLAAVGLIQARESAKLQAFIDAYIGRRQEVKPNTRRNLEACKARLVEHFGPDKLMRDITPGDADAWLSWLLTRYAKGTAGRTVKRAKQFFTAAMRSRLILTNPFADVRPPSQANEARKFFVTREMAKKVTDACPDAEWRLIFALCRFGGLRCPSELLALTWADVDWERHRFLVRSPKLEHMENGGERWVPIFPELRPALEEAFDQAEPGTLHVIQRHRTDNANLRTQFRRIIRKAGLMPWPKLFQNLRASRETELANEFSLHKACAWIGNSAMIAKDHYLQVRDEDFEQAAGCAAKSAASSPESALPGSVQSPAADDGQAAPKGKKIPEIRDFDRLLCITAQLCQFDQIPPRGVIALESTWPLVPGKDFRCRRSNPGSLGEGVSLHNARILLLLLLLFVLGSHPHRSIGGSDYE